MKRRLFWLLLGGTLVSAILMTVLVYATTEPYEAHAMLQVSPPPADMLPSMYPVYDRREFDEFKNSMLGRVTDPFVINAALRDPEIANCSILQNVKYKDLWLQEHLSASLSDDFIRISLCGDNPQDLAAIVRAVTAAFEKEVIEVQQQRRRRNLDELRQITFNEQARLEGLNSQMAQLDRQIRATNTEQNTLAMQIKQDLLLQLRSEYGEIRMQIIHKEVQLAALQGSSPEEAEGLQEEIDRMRVYEQLFMEQLDEIKLESQILAINLVERDVLSREIETLRERVEQMEDRVYWFEIALEHHPDQVRVYYQADVPRRKNRCDRIRRWLGV